MATKRHKSHKNIRIRFLLVFFCAFLWPPIAVLRDKHAEHAVLPGGDEQLAVAASAGVQVRTGGLCAAGLIDELLPRDGPAVAAWVAPAEVNYYDRSVAAGATG